MLNGFQRYSKIYQKIKSVAKYCLLVLGLLHVRKRGAGESPAGVARGVPLNLLPLQLWKAARRCGPTKPFLQQPYLLLITGRSLILL
jgi:hypothetical protein